MMANPFSKTIYGVKDSYLRKLVHVVPNYCYDSSFEFSFKFVRVNNVRTDYGSASATARDRGYYPFVYESETPSISRMEDLADMAGAAIHIELGLKRSNQEATLAKDSLIIAIWLVKCYGPASLGKYLVDWAVKLAAAQKIPDGWLAKRPREMAAMAELASGCHSLGELRSRLGELGVEPPPLGTGKIADIGSLVRHIENCAELPPASGVRFPDMGGARELTGQVTFKL